MGFLSGPITFECFRVGGSPPGQFGPQHIKVLQKFAIGKLETAATDQPDVGFLAGRHVFDVDFGLEKNVIGEAFHFGLRIDTNPIPAAVRKAWLQMELAAVTAEDPDARPTKAQRQEAKEAVEARCEEEARSGRFRRMQMFPVLWDARKSLLYFGGSSLSASELFADLFSRAFDLELERLTAGHRAGQWATDTKHRKALDDTLPAAMLAAGASTDIAWRNTEAGNFDYLGNEFLLWLWWHLETQGDTVALSDGSEVTGMIARTLRLECPREESGKETITAEAPTRLPEAALAIRSGKLPRKAGLTLVRHGEQYELVLQAETFSVSGAKIRTDEEASQGHGALEDRLESLRNLEEIIDLVFRAFCDRRIGKAWPGDLEQIRRWLKKDVTARKPAA
jgi:hypothetical protein